MILCILLVVIFPLSFPIFESSISLFFFLISLAKGLPIFSFKKMDQLSFTDFLNCLCGLCGLEMTDF